VVGCGSVLQYTPVPPKPSPSSKTRPRGFKLQRFKYYSPTSTLSLNPPKKGVHTARKGKNCTRGHAWHTEKKNEIAEVAIGRSREIRSGKENCSQSSMQASNSGSKKRNKWQIRNRPLLKQTFKRGRETNTVRAYSKQNKRWERVELSKELSRTYQTHTATCPCNMLLQHNTATCYCKVLLQHISATHIPLLHYCNTLLQHTAATHCCNTLLQHTAATHYCNTPLPHFCKVEKNIRDNGKEKRHALCRCVAVVCCSSVLP